MNTFFASLESLKKTTPVWRGLDELNTALHAVASGNAAGPLPLQLIEAAMVSFAPQTAFESANGNLSYHQVDILSAGFASFLQNILGVAKGDHIAVMLPNLLAFPVTFIGVLRAGAVQVNVNPNYTPRELLHQLNDSGARTLVLYEGSLETFTAISSETKVENVIIVARDDIGSDATVSTADFAGLTADMHDMKMALAAGSKKARQPVALMGDDRMFLQYTGGTTGLSKGAVLTHRNLGANILQFHAYIHGTLKEGQEIVITALPLYHIFALMVNFLSTFVIGAKNILIANPSDLNGVVDVIKHSNFSIITGVNTLFEALLGHPEFAETDFSNYRFAIGGGTPILETTSDKWEKVTGHAIKTGYGLSETSPLVCLHKMDVPGYRPDVGPAMPLTEIIVLSSENKKVDNGAPGELCVKGPQVTSGYWNRPDDNQSVFTEDGFFRTGDIAICNETGDLEIVDRKKDMILVSGFNVYPNEIEAVVATHPGVAESICIGIPDGRTGEAVKVFVVRKANEAVSAEDLISFCRRSLTGYKVPKQVEFRDKLPKSAVGKLLRRELRQ